MCVWRGLHCETFCLSFCTCEYIVRNKEKERNLKVTGSFETCVSCSLEKINKRNVNKDNKNKRTVPGERIYFDIRSVK